MRNFTMILIFTFISSLSYAQFDLMKKVEKKVEEAVDKSSEEKKESENKPEEGKKEEKAEPAESAEPAASEAKPANELKIYSKFDFIPGDKIIFFDDFSEEATGDFPKRWNTNGSGEVIDLSTNNSKWFKLTNAVSYTPYIKFDTFGDNYTVEADILFVTPPQGNYGQIYFDFFGGGDIDEVPSASSGPYLPGIEFMIAAERGGRTNFTAKGTSMDENGALKSGQSNSTQYNSFIDNKVNRLSFSFNGTRFRAYLNEQKVVDLPRVIKEGTMMNRLNIRTWSWNTTPDYSALIKNIRIAQGKIDTRNQLLTEGKIVTRGILFDSGSDKIKPESYGTLKDISAVLKENSQVRVKIVGHTDNDGQDASNLELSKKRAGAVKTALQNEFGIPDTQLETDGKGESEPAGPNDTAEGKANNRRVEFIKI